jgi:hypothetical protein
VTGVVPTDELATGDTDPSRLTGPSRRSAGSLPGRSVSGVRLWVARALSRRPPPRVDDDQLSPDELAIPVRSDEDIRRHDRYRTNARTFRVDDGCVDVPVVVQNSGSRTMSDYKFSITFADDAVADDRVRLRDVQTETMSVDGLFCDPDSYTSNRPRIPDERIIESYDRLGMPGHFLTSSHG